MTSYLNKPYDLLEIKRFKALYLYGIALYMFLFLSIFEPFGMYNLSGLYKLKIISLYVFSGLFISMVHLFWLQNKIIKTYNLRNTILWISWITLLTSLSSSLINDIAFNHGHFTFLSFIVFIGIVFGITIVPILVLILWHYVYTLQKQIKISGQLNKMIQEKGETSSNSETILFESSNKRENISLPINNFLYITSADNYIDVYYKEENAIKHNLLRNTLGNIEEKFSENKNIQRCHLSFIVNIGLIDSILGNASGYKIQLRQSKILIPISRKYKEKIFDLLKS
jgi:LytTr DNA-binding domain